jgi:ATP-binding cassette subfamily C (CFTR/MRP) protein 1
MTKSLEDNRSNPTESKESHSEATEMPESVPEKPSSSAIAQTADLELLSKISAVKSNAAYTDAVMAEKHKPAAIDSANLFSRIFYSWLTPLMKLGKKRPIHDEDLYEVPQDVDAHGVNELFERYWKEQLKLSKPSLAKALINCYFYSFWGAALLKILADALTFLQPQLLTWLITYVANVQFKPPGQEPPAWEGYIIALALFVDPILVSLLTNSYFTITMTIGLKIRTILITSIFKKSLRLSPAARNNMSTGQTINMMSTDASKLDLFMGYAHYTWTTLLQIAAACGLLIRALGPPALAGIAVLVILIPLQGRAARSIAGARKYTAKFTDQRVKVMNEILSGIRVIKVYAWENSFLNKLSAIRVEEMKGVKKSLYIRAITTFVMGVGPVFMSVLAFITLGLTTSTLNPADIFSSVVLFNLLRFPLMLWPMTFGMVS